MVFVCIVLQLVRSSASRLCFKNLRTLTKPPMMTIFHNSFFVNLFLPEFFCSFSEFFISFTSYDCFLDSTSGLVVRYYFLF